MSSIIHKRCFVCSSQQYVNIFVVRINNTRQDWETQVPLNTYSATYLCDGNNGNTMQKTSTKEKKGPGETQQNTKILKYTYKLTSN